MFMYDVKSRVATEFIDNKEILDTKTRVIVN